MKGAKTLFSSANNEWGTPQFLFEELNDKYHFTLDPCSTDENAKCSKHYTIEDNGLSKEWINEIVFCNPPYGKEIGKWAEKCYQESCKGVKIVMLVPARVDTKWFHNFIYQKPNVRIEFIKGRLKFENPLCSKPANAPFPSMLVYFNL